MAIDQYQQCYCGSGKKVKFCCSSDILNELGKITRAIDGGQILTALDQVNQLIAAKGPRPTTLLTKCELLVSLKRIDDAQQVIVQLLELRPVTRVTYAFASLIAALREDLAEAIEKLQRAMESPFEIWHPRGNQAIFAIAHLLLRQGDFLGGRAYFEMLIAIDPEGARSLGVPDILSELTEATSMSPLLKQSFTAVDGPEDAIWIEEFNRAKDLSEMYQWWKALEIFEDLASKHPLEPAILHNVAILRTRLGNRALTANAWRKYSQTPGVALEDAVEAEALAQLVEPTDPWGTRREYKCFAIKDAETYDRLREFLVSSSRISAPGVRICEVNELDDVKAVATGAIFSSEEDGLSLQVNSQTIPTTLATYSLFGKETTKPARILFSLPLLPDIEKIRKSVMDLFAPFLDAEFAEKTPEYRAEPLLFSYSRSPAFEQMEQAEDTWDLDEKHHEVFIHDYWVHARWPALDNKSPVEVAADPNYRIRLLAIILRMELVDLDFLLPCNYNKLRANLGLPTLDSFNLQSSASANLPFIRLHRLEMESLSDNHLEALLDFTRSYGLRTTVKRIAEEIERRPSMADSDALYAALDAIVMLARYPQITLPAAHKLFALAKKLNRDPIAEGCRLLTLYQDYRKHAEFEQLIKKLVADYGNNQETGATLLRYLKMMGLVPTERAATSAQAAEQGKLWTPDSQTSSSPASSSLVLPSADTTAGKEETPGKSKLWLPGMD